MDSIQNVFKIESYKNDHPHILLNKGFTLVCTFICKFIENPDPCTLQENNSHLVSLSSSYSSKYSGMILRIIKFFLVKIHNPFFILSFKLETISISKHKITKYKKKTRFVLKSETTE